MAKRERTKTRADMIAMLKSRGVRGRLSKMTKAQLRDKLEDTEPKHEDQEGDGKPAHHKSGELELEADTQAGGHFYKADGSTSSKQTGKYKHEHRKKDWPAQKGSGSTYRTFMGKEMKAGVSMKDAAAKWKTQKGSGVPVGSHRMPDGTIMKDSDMKGGHMVKKDGTVGAKQAAKYKHSHRGENPSTDSRAAPITATAKAASSGTAAKTARAKRATEQNKKNSLPNALSPTTKAVMKAPAKEDDTPDKPKQKQAKSEDSMFDTLEQKKAKQKATEDAAKPKAKTKKRSSAVASAPTAPKPKQSTRMSSEEKIKKAKERLKKGGYKTAYFEHQDKAFAKGIFDKKQIAENWKRGKASQAKAKTASQDKQDDLEFGQKEEDERQAESTKAAKAAIKASGKIKKKMTPEQEAAALLEYDEEQDGGGWLDSVGHWAKKHEGDIIEDTALGAAGLLGGPLGEAAAEGLEGVIGASEAAESAAAEEEAAGVALDGAPGDEGALDRYAKADGEDNAARDNLESEVAKRKKLLQKPKGMRSVLQAGREGRMLETGNYADKPGLVSSLTSDAAGAQLRKNAAGTAYAAGSLWAAKSLEDMNPGPDDDNGPPAPAPAPAPAPGPAPNPTDARAQQRADAYSSNYDMLYGNHNEDGAYPWS